MSATVHRNRSEVRTLLRVRCTMPWLIAIVACGRPSEPARRDASMRSPPPADALQLDAAAAPANKKQVLASWGSKPTGTPSPACIVGTDRFVQYADVEEPGAVRLCLWWNLGNSGFPDVGCWRIDLVTGKYDAQTGVWFSSPQPLRVGDGGGAAGRPRSAGTTSLARWRDDGLEVCRDAACKRLPLAKPTDKSGNDADDVVFDDRSQL